MKHSGLSSIEKDRWSFMIWFMELQEILNHINEVQSIIGVRGESRNSTLSAARNVTPKEIPFFFELFWLRELPSFIILRKRYKFSINRKRPLVSCIWFHTACRRRKPWLTYESDNRLKRLFDDRQKYNNRLLDKTGVRWLYNERKQSLYETKLKRIQKT